MMPASSLRGSSAARQRGKEVQQAAQEGKRRCAAATMTGTLRSTAGTIDHGDQAEEGQPAKRRAHVGVPAGGKPRRRHRRWSCPKCGVTAFNQWQNMNHRRRHHPDDAIPRANAAVAIKPTDCIPSDQRAWECPLCHKGLPHLSIWQRTLAIRNHVRDEHPREDVSEVKKKARTSSSSPMRKATGKVLRILYSSA